MVEVTSCCPGMASLDTRCATTRSMCQQTHQTTTALLGARLQVSFFPPSSPPSRWRRFWSPFSTLFLYSAVFGCLAPGTESAMQVCEDFFRLFVPR